MLYKHHNIENLTKECIVNRSRGSGGKGDQYGHVYAHFDSRFRAEHSGEFHFCVETLFLNSHL